MCSKLYVIHTVYLRIALNSTESLDNVSCRIVQPSAKYHSIYLKLKAERGLLLNNVSELYV